MSDAPEESLPRIAAAEWSVAEAVWKAGRPASSIEIVEQLSGATARHPKTVRTLLHRLVQKQVLVKERRGRVDYYFPRLSRNEYLELETRSLLERLFGGRRIALLEHYLSEGSDLTPAELATLRERLEELERGGERRR
jgi:BlaI family penicillinase repressor